MIEMKDGTSAYTFDYDENGNVQTFISGNEVGTSFSYDERNLVSSLHIGAKNGGGIFRESYEYDANGNRTVIDSSAGGKVQYEYGKLNQLVKETHEDGTVIQYTYDGFGNRTNVTTTKDGASKSVNASFNIMNQLTKVNDEDLSYDKNGNRTSDGKYTYTWDAEDNLTAVTKKAKTSRSQHTNTMKKETESKKPSTETSQTTSTTETA